jgi:hypothetical protein
MLVNILLTDLSFPSFYLKIVRGESEAVYECQRIASAPNNASCIGEKMPPGQRYEPNYAEGKQSDEHNARDEQSFSVHGGSGY